MGHKEKVKGTSEPDLNSINGEQSASDIKEVVKGSQYDVSSMPKEELHMLLSKGILIDNEEQVNFLLNFQF